MPGAISSSTAVDLSRLPPPRIVEPLDYETILAAMTADLAARDPGLADLGDADPAIKVLQVAAYRELLLRQRVNEACRAVMIAYAAAGDLDQLAAVFGVTRLEIAPANPQTGTPAIVETDDELRRRILLAPESYSVAGPTGAYRFHALSADPDVRDANAVSPAPGDVVVAVLSRSGDGTPAADVLAAVEARVSGDTVRPLTDRVTVVAADLVAFDVEATLHLYAGPDAALIEASARTALQAFLERERAIGRDIPMSAIIAALHVGGVHRVDLTTPVADIVVSPVQAPAPGAIALALQVTGE